VDDFTNRERGSQGRLPALPVLALLVVAALTLVLAIAPPALAVELHVVSSEGLEIPGVGPTTAPPGSRLAAGVTTVLSPVGGTEATTVELAEGAPGGEVLDAYLLAGHVSPVTLGAGAEVKIAASGAAVWRATLYDYDPEAGTNRALGQGSAPGIEARATVSITLDNPQISLAPGHALRLVISGNKSPQDSAAVVFNGGGVDEATWLSLEELDVTPPTSFFSTSPPAPDGDDGWFISPVVVTLWATDPEGSPTIIYYDWNLDPPAGVYAGSFLTPSGTNTLYLRAVDAFDQVEETQAHEFRVDTSASAPAIQAPRGSADSPTPVRGAVAFTAQAEDMVSGIANVSFFYFGQTARGWQPVGSEAGPPQTTAAEGTLYGVSWETVTVADGAYRLRAQVRDNAGNLAFSAPEYVLVDNTRPTIGLSAPSPGEHISGTYRVSGTIDDAALTGWRLEIRPLSGGDWQIAAEGRTPRSGGLHTLETTDLEDGDYQLRVTAVDAAGNQAEAVTRVTIDNQPPTVESAASGGPTFVELVFDEELDIESVAPEHFSIAGLDVEGAAPQPDGRTVILTTSEQVDGLSYEVSIATRFPTLTDRAGNAPAASVGVSFRGSAVDALAPATPRGLQALSGAGRNVLSWTANSEPDLAGYRLYRDVEPERAFARRVGEDIEPGATQTADDSYGEPGVYWYKLSAVDGSGNESEKSQPVSADSVRIALSVGPDGAVLESSTGEIRVTIPGGAVPPDTPVEIVERGAPSPDQPAFDFLSPTFELLPADLAFEGEVTILIRYPQEAVASREIDPETIRVVRAADSSWRPLPPAGDEEGDRRPGEVEGVATSAGLFAAAATDVTPPLLLEQSPAPGAPTVSVKEHVTLTFSEPLAPTTLTADALQLRGADGPVPLERIAFSEDLNTVYLYPEGALAVSSAYTVVVTTAVTDAAGNSLPSEVRSSFTTAPTGVSPHDRYSDADRLCAACHDDSGEDAPGIFTRESERQVCYSCHDGTGSSLNVKTRDETPPFTWDFGEDRPGESAQASFHPVPAAGPLGTAVRMVCSNCHIAHPTPGSGTRSSLSVKPVDASLGGSYARPEGNEFCWMCHDKTAEASAGYLPADSWAASTGFDHRSFYPPEGVSHNDLARLGVTDPGAWVSSRHDIACKGCHSEHGSSNSKLVAEVVGGSNVTFSSADAQGYDSTYNTVCLACHAAAGSGGFSWPSGGLYETSGHGASRSVRLLAYSPPVPAVDQQLRTGLCKQCHEPHGAGDENGAFDNLTRFFEEGVCYSCHRAGANVAGAKDLAVAFGRDSSHNLGLSSTEGRRHDLNAEYEAPLNPNPAQSGSKRNVECVDCHNPHASEAAINGGLHLRGTAEVSGALKGVWGVEPANGEAWSAPAGWDWTDSRVFPAAFEYQICLKCHSAAAYGGTPPARPRNDSRGRGYWPLTSYTDQSREFNPNNASYHAVWGESKASGFGTYVNGWAATSRMYCSDCHRSDAEGDPLGAHGADSPFLLGGNTVPANSRYVTGPRPTPYPDKDARDADYTFCFECHDPGFADSGFSDTEGDNLHAESHGTAPCTACHAAVPHGWQREHLLVVRSDPAPYNDHGQAYGIPDSLTWQESTEWTFESCHNDEGTGCHSPAVPPEVPED
jgi:predicted CXXCH cytochrome family protein